MGIYTITATSTDDDYKRPYVHSESRLASSHEDAVAVAVSMYLEVVQDYEKFEYHDSATFDAIVDKHSGDFRALMTDLHAYFERDADGLFVGEFVPCTFEVTISGEQGSIALDVEEITSLVNEIRHGSGEE